MFISKFLTKLRKPSLLNDFLIIIASLILLVIALIFWFGNKIYKDYDKQNSIILDDTAKKFERSIINDIKYTQYQMDYISQQIKERGNSKKQVYKILSPFTTVSKLNLAINWNMFSWVDKTQHIVVDGVIGILQDPRDLRKRDYLPKTISKPKILYLGNPVYGAVSNQWIIPAGMGVVNKNNQYIGSIVFGFDIDNMMSKLESIVPEQGIEFAILNQNNKLISPSSNPETTQEKINNFINNQKQETSYINLLRSKKQYSSLITIDNYPIKIFIKYNNDYIRQKFLNEWFYYVAQFSITCILIIILLIMIRHKIISPILKLSKFANMVSKGNLEMQIPSFSSIEINNLSNSLNDIKKYIKREHQLKEELKKAENIANIANNAKTRLLQSTSHDLRNYISSISGILNLIIKNKSQKEISKSQDLQDISILAKQSEELNQFVEDLLDINQLDNNELLVQKFEEHDLGKFINRIIILNKNLLIKNKISIKTTINENLPKLRCDGKSIKQILMNLITNSAKYSPPQSNIYISANHDKISNSIELIVEDEGYGMTKEEIKMALSGEGIKIDKSQIQQNIDSHGIGFPQIDRLVKLHKGIMKIYSNKNSGTKISIFFPLSGDVSENFKNHILVIAKNKSEYKELENIITKNLHDTIAYHASTKKIAKEMSTQRNYDLILNSINLKDIGNIEISDLLNNNVPAISENKKGKNIKNKKISSEIFIRTMKKLIGIKDENIHQRSLEKIKPILENKRILIAEDELPNQLILKKYLSKFKLKIDLANNGKEALDKYTKNPSSYDIILTDINMPIMSGKKSSIKMREFEKKNNLKPIPIISCSSDCEKEKVHAFYYSKINDHFVKGRSNDYLVKILSFWLEGVKSA